MKNHQYTIHEIEEAIYNQLVETRSTYKYMVDFVWPLIRQQAICDVFPSLLRLWDSTAKQSIIIGIGKLIDDSRDSLVIHFKKFLNVAKNTSDKNIKDREAWTKFNNESRKFILELPALKKKLNPLRNKNWAHLSPALPESSERTTWEYWSLVLERMEKIFNLYSGAVHRKGIAQFYVMNLEYEPKIFFEWCRLDDFKKRREDELKVRKLKV